MLKEMLAPKSDPSLSTRMGPVGGALTGKFPDTHPDLTRKL